ncbi:thioredoxin domain-containing protein [Gottschalkia purinilytica]|uniref:Thioredoxin domain-containing protein n=1 Tax=Gottschalkia purinilytica TaxID=1503 RepID=A0A0L0WAZ0_GOTPU|nr:TlpA disulfide reductase family protein [Gottschalkia purinilytica]KNF08663.1 thioredoxin domain-containing protein [Gottschalkia purinilytica]
MRKGIILIALVLSLSIFFIGCKKENKPKEKSTTQSVNTETADNKDKEGYYKLDELGVEYKVPDKWSKSENISAFVLEENKEDKNDPIYGAIIHDFVPVETLKLIKENEKKLEDINEESEKILEQIHNSQLRLLNIIAFDKDKLKKSLDSGKKIEDFTKCVKNELVKEKDNLAYYICYGDSNTESLSDESRKIYDELSKDIDNLKNSIKVFKPVKSEEKLSDIKKVPEFKAKDLKGKEVTEKIFQNNKLTMINVWATFCGPCISEMKDLQALYKDLKKEGVNIVGLIGDIENDETKKLAQDIIKNKGVEFTNIIPDKTLKDNILKSVPGFPTSIFIDKEGNIVGEPIVGARSKDEYKKIIMDVLKDIK